jgi:hypothetical protein
VKEWRGYFFLGAVCWGVLLQKSFFIYDYLKVWKSLPVNLSNILCKRGWKQVVQGLPITSFMESPVGSCITSAKDMVQLMELKEELLLLLLLLLLVGPTELRAKQA